jgi:hypothetical protein
MTTTDNYPRTVQTTIDALVSKYQMRLDDAQNAVQRRLAEMGYVHTLPADPVRPQDYGRILSAAAVHYLQT